MRRVRSKPEQKEKDKGKWSASIIQTGRMRKSGAHSS
jgi:hypothetical protein